MQLSLPPAVQRPRYQLAEKVGEGAYGAVYAAKDTTTGVRVAVKSVREVTERGLNARLCSLASL